MKIGHPRKFFPAKCENFAVRLIPESFFQRKFLTLKYVCSEGKGEKVDEGVGVVYERCMNAFQKIIECYFNFFKTINFQIPNFVMVLSFKKIFNLEWILRYQFLTQKRVQINPFGPNGNFLENFIHVISVYSLFTIMVQSFKKIFGADSKISDYVVLDPKTGPKLPLCPKWEFFG